MEFLLHLGRGIGIMCLMLGTGSLPGRPVSSATVTFLSTHKNCAEAEVRARQTQVAPPQGLGGLPRGIPPKPPTFEIQKENEAHSHPACSRTFSHQHSMSTPAKCLGRSSPLLALPGSLLSPFPGVSSHSSSCFSLFAMSVVFSCCPSHPGPILHS